MIIKNRQKSFTLIELLVVIVIIGILAGVVMISTSSSIDKASIAKVKVFEESVRNNLILNLVSEYNFDDSSDPYKDSWGTNNCSMVVPQGVAYPELKSDNCVSKNCLNFLNIGMYDSGSYLNCGFLSNATNIWTLELWIRSYDSGRMPLALGKATIYSVSGIAWGGDMWYPGIGSIYDNKWHHLIFTYSSNNLINNNNVFAYIDGNLVAQGSKAWNAINGPIYIGKGYGWEDKNGYPYKGLVDEIKIYNSYFSQSQIKQNYIAGLDSMLSNGIISKEEYNKKINTLAYDN